MFYYFLICFMTISFNLYVIKNFINQSVNGVINFHIGRGLSRKCNYAFARGFVLTRKGTFRFLDGGCIALPILHNDLPFQHHMFRLGFVTHFQTLTELIENSSTFFYYC